MGIPCVDKIFWKILSIDVEEDSSISLEIMESLAEMDRELVGMDMKQEDRGIEDDVRRPFGGYKRDAVVIAAVELCTRNMWF